MAISADLAKKWNKKVDKDSINNVKNMDTSNNSGDFPELECGTYAVEIEKLELVSTKMGDPMVTCWLKVCDGSFKGRLMFFNQVINQDFQIHSANEFLRGILDNTDVDIDVQWTGDYEAYAQMVEDIYNAVKNTYSYDIEYSKNKKGYSVYKVLEVYDK